jgi:hypothetical protein
LARPKLDAQESQTGQFVVWRVLGFGGRPNPLVYSRAASFAMRSAQALAGSPNRSCQHALLSQCRGQLYVDDPVWTHAGTPAQNKRTTDLLLTWWLVLGLPLAWKKGTWVPEAAKHAWIGVEFTPSSPGRCIMACPDAFVASVVEDLLLFAGKSKTAPRAAAERLVGRVGRLSQIVPTTRPFAGALFAARTAAFNAVSQEAPPGKVAVKRFRTAATWFLTLLRDASFEPIILSRIVWAHTPEVSVASPWSLEFDASPWGGGAVLYEGGKPREWFHTAWTNEHAPSWKVVTGDSRHQSFWEFYTLLLSLMLWAGRLRTPGLRVIGDNTGALADALKLSGSGSMMAIAREISWRQVRGQWNFAVGHLPGEHNTVADSLSRAFDPDPAAHPGLALKGAIQTRPSDPKDVWKCQPT